LFPFDVTALNTVAVPFCVLPTRDTPLGPEQAKIKFYRTFADVEKDRPWLYDSSASRYLE
jgi:hypothetical protein